MEWFPVKILDGGYTLCGKQWETRGMFTVPFCRLYLVVSGGAQVIIGKHELELQRGNVYFLPGNILSRNGCNDFMEVFWVHFAPLSLWLEHFLAHHKEVHTWPLEKLKNWEHVYCRLKRFSFAENSSEHYRLQSFLIYLLADLLADKNQIIDSGLFLRLKNALLFMDREYLRNPPLAAIAAKANMAPNYFHRKFRELFPSFTPYSYMEAKRMRDAKTFLAVGHSLKETAEMTGYSNVFYFSRSFKKVFGKSPGIIRKEATP